jgi:DNA-binding transcriptional LysR family regulator
MDTRHLRAALAVQKHGTFTAAARAMFMAQSTLSRQVGTLERRLGLELFVRGPDRAVPTDAGSRFLAEAKNVIAAVEAAERAAREAAEKCG